LADNPHLEYSRRLKERRETSARLDQLNRRIAALRLVLFLGTAVLCWFVLIRTSLSSWWLIVPLVLFVVLVTSHEYVRRQLRRLERAVAFYERGLARLENRWGGAGEEGLRFLDETHPYAVDLDLFGRESLFELLCSARTRAGEETLAAWLKTPAEPDEIRALQTAVQELRTSLDLREELALLGTDVRAGVQPDALTGWAVSPPLLEYGVIRILAAVLAGATLISLIWWLLFGGEKAVFGFLASAELCLALYLRRPVRRVVDAVDGPCRDLALLSQVLKRLERENFSSPRLLELRRQIETEGKLPSSQIAHLNRLIVLLDSRRNQIFAPLAILLLWGTQLAFSIEAWRLKSGPAVPRWLAAVGEIEALSSFAGYSYEHPRDIFPEIEDQKSACFDGKALGHPLIAEDRCVRNDVKLQDSPQVLLVSGSNMSGKSTLLRSVGSNAVLALAGAPVRAERLRISPLAVGASIRIVDSLQTGISRFYSEITRLRQLVDLTEGPRPLLFLLDELLHGTNSHDRRIGAEAVVKDFVRRGAVGLLTTHDLALAHIADVLSPRAANVHFQDHIEDGRIVFDYCLRPGIVTKSNALELMRSVGLEV